MLRNLLPCRPLAFFLLVALSNFHTAYPQEKQSNALRFNQNIRPILSGACFRCHGADAKTREAELRLDISDGAFSTRASGEHAIVPGKIDESLIWARIQSTDPDTVMPPPSSNRQLTEEEKQSIANWIGQGAKYEKHWSFEQIAPSKEEAYSIDEFLERERKLKGLVAQGPTDAITQVRRLAFTLTGLPPSLSDVENFVIDPTDANYVKLVDQYLASPHYGEEMAKHWLDVARYGDTHGMHLDNERQAWAYRDWVVEAFNSNMPFSQFTIEQLAGDLLPSPSLSQQVATGYNRCNVTTGEGGAIDDEFLFRYAVDRTSTTVQTWLGLTGGCAVCHDHKYDPISTREFYSMYAFFYSAADPAMDGNVESTRPFLPLPNAEQKQELGLAKDREAGLLEKLKRIASDKEQIAYETQSSIQHAGPVTAVWMDDEFPIGSAVRNTSRNDARWSSDIGAPMGRRALRQDDRCRRAKSSVSRLCENLRHARQPQRQTATRLHDASDESGSDAGRAEVRDQSNSNRLRGRIGAVRAPVPRTAGVRSTHLRHDRGDRSPSRSPRSEQSRVRQGSRQGDRHHQRPGRYRSGSTLQARRDLGTPEEIGSVRRWIGCD